ncbi:hypothetical protein NDU88_002439 [Pleurodeles waltl]|uniref:Uncharacterized protein n=1 Tax=Pleurodeles waltl TaxID=8319 RepID=A0AAV7MMN1_PLEWA|nr:hypothetical protein NDU88_002439 [Pleurodeles waltl]
MGTRVTSFLGNASPPATKIVRHTEVRVRARQAQSPRARGPQRNNKGKYWAHEPKKKEFTRCAASGVCVQVPPTPYTHVHKTKQTPGFLATVTKTLGCPVLRRQNSVDIGQRTSAGDDNDEHIHIHCGTQVVSFEVFFVIFFTAVTRFSQQSDKEKRFQS